MPRDEHLFVSDRICCKLKITNLTWNENKLKRIYDYNFYILFISVKKKYVQISFVGWLVDVEPLQKHGNAEGSLLLTKCCHMLFVAIYFCSSLNEST